MSDELESVASLVHRFRVPRAGCTMNVCLGLPKICRAVERITIAEHYDRYRHRYRYRGPFKPRNRCFHRFVPPLGTSKALQNMCEDVIGRGAKRPETRKAVAVVGEGPKTNAKPNQMRWLHIQLHPHVVRTRCLRSLQCHKNCHATHMKRIRLVAQVVR